MDILKSLLSTVAPSLASLLGGPLAGAIVSIIGTKILGKSDASTPELIAALQDPANIIKLKELDVQIIQSLSAVDVAQANVNAVEAASDDKIKSYWRPLAGWVCVIGLAYAYIISPILITIGVKAAPIANFAELNTLLLAMLGLTTARTVEKLRG